MLTLTEARMKYFGTSDKRKINELLHKWVYEVEDRHWSEYFSPSFSRDGPIMPDETNPEAHWDENSKVHYHYIAENLPHALPTIPQIEALHGTEAMLPKTGYQMLYKVFDVFVVKIGRLGDLLTEAENMLYLEKNCKIRIPKIYAAFSHRGGAPAGVLGPDNDQTKRRTLPTFHYLVMEFIEGTHCDRETWKKLSETTRTTILRKTGEQLRHLRSVPPPSPTYYGRIYGQPWHSYVRLVHHGKINSQWGPFETYKDFIGAVYDASEYASSIQAFATEDYDSGLLAFLSSFKEIMSRANGWEPVLTHLDLHEGNIIFTGEGEDTEVAMIDWTALGWMPKFVEAASLLNMYFFSTGDCLWECTKEESPPYLDTVVYLNKFLSMTCNDIS